MRAEQEIRSDIDHTVGQALGEIAMALEIILDALRSFDARLANLEAKP